MSPWASERTRGGVAGSSLELRMTGGKNEVIARPVKAVVASDQRTKRIDSRSKLRTPHGQPSYTRRPAAAGRYRDLDWQQCGPH